MKVIEGEKLSLSGVQRADMGKYFHPIMKWGEVTMKQFL